MDLLIILLFVLPISRNSLFWSFIWQFKEYRFDRFIDFIKTFDGFKTVFNLTYTTEILVLYSLFRLDIMSSNRSIFISLLIIFLVFENIFSLYKIFRKTMLMPKFTKRAVITIVFSIIIQVVLLLIFSHYILFSYILFAFLISQIFIIWLSILITSPITYYQKAKICKLASKKIRSFSDLITIWITWSCWKSTTKEILYQCLSEQFRTVKTPENNNTPLGISNTILKTINKNTEIFVCEMWAYCLWEIAELWDIANHKYWILSEINDQHLWLFWNIENTIKTKFELTKKIKENEWILYINWDSENCIKWLGRNNWFEVVKYWIENLDCDARIQIKEIKNMQTIFDFSYKEKIYHLTTNLIWDHNILNLAWALALAIDLWLKKSQIQNVLLNLSLPDNSFKIRELPWNVKIIDNSYNSNLSWIIASCKTLEFFNCSNQVLILDDVLELWKQSKKLHFKLWKDLSKFNFKWIFLVWKNYSLEIRSGLISWWFDQSKIFSKPILKKDIKELAWEESCLLFQWRESRKYIFG